MSFWSPLHDSLRNEIYYLAGNQLPRRGRYVEAQLLIAKIRPSSVSASDRLLFNRGRRDQGQVCREKVFFCRLQNRLNSIHDSRGFAIFFLVMKSAKIRLAIKMV